MRPRRARRTRPSAGGAVGAVGRGLVSGTGIIITGLVATLLALIFPVWSYSDRSGTALQVLDATTVSTPYGPLSTADRDFVVRLRRAGLWEKPAGLWARQKGTTPQVRKAGRHLAEGHAGLDQRVLDVGARLGVTLPAEPDERQRAWLDVLNGAQGVDFDREFVNLLRLAHGRMFTEAARIRVSTRNSEVRALADDAPETLLAHIRLLEATGHVDYEALARDMAAQDDAPTPAVTLRPPRPATPLPPPAPSAPAPPASSAAPPPAPDARRPSPETSLPPGLPLPPATSGPPPSDGS